MINLPLGKSTDSPIKFKAGTVLFAEGEVSKYLFVVKKGQVGLFKRNGQQLIVTRICREKEILNEVSVFTNKSTEFAAIAKTDVEMVLVETKDILSVMKGGSPWIPEIFRTLCERLASTMEIIEEHNLMGGEKNPELILNKEEEIKYLNALDEYEAP